MAKIGRVYKGTYKKDNVEYPTLTLEIRTITIKKDFTISVNKYKWESGRVGEGSPVQGKENSPDYHIWGNLNKRGESNPSEIVGGITDKIGQSGNKYKNASICDPFVQKEPIFFNLFSIDEAKKSDKNQLYTAVAGINYI